MKEIMVLVEHRRGEVRDITWEMLSRGRELAEQMEAEINAVLLGDRVDSFAEALRPRANHVFVVQDESLQIFNSESYERVLRSFLEERKPILTMVSHSSTGMDLAPSLAVRLKMPLATDCVNVEWNGASWSLTRPMYGGKIYQRVFFNRDGPCMVTVRSGSFPLVEREPVAGEIVPLPCPKVADPLPKRFLEYVESALEGIDITKSDILVAVGRGMKGPENIPLAKELADALGGTLACSRPVVDRRWLPKNRQVGTSGKTVTPKVYIALGISGAFQHVAGMKGAGTIIAINKDPKAPIFNIAHYGVVADLFKVLPILKEKAKAFRQR